MDEGKEYQKPFRDLWCLLLTQGNGLQSRRRTQIYRKLTTEWVQKERTKKGSLPKQPG